MDDLAVLLERTTAGGLMAGHGAQKLFGMFGGYGPEGTGGWLESMGFAPGKQWAMLAGGSELSSGLMTALGFMHPLGPLTMLAPMAIATARAHADKPIWATEGGAELPLMYMTTALSVALAGPGRYSLDRMLGIRLPWWFTALAALGTAGGVLFALNQRPQASEQAEEGALDPQGGQEPTPSEVAAT